MRITNKTPVGKRKVYDISVADAEHYSLANGAVLHNSGAVYSSDWIIIVGKQQEKDGTDLVGFNFVLNIEKSRFVREKSKIPLEVRFDGGIGRWSGMLDLALESGLVVKPSNGWYSRVDSATGEVEEKKFRRADTDTTEFWAPIIKNKKFHDWIESQFKLSESKMVDDSDIDLAYAEVNE